MTNSAHANRFPAPRRALAQPIRGHAGQGRLALVDPVPAPAPAPRQLLIDGRLGDDFGPVATSARLLPAPGPWCARLALALAEVLDGRRPVTQLVRWIDHPVALGLRGQLAAAPHGSRGLRANTRTQAPLSLKSLRWSAPADGVIEAAAIVVGSVRPSIMTLRVEGRDGRWLCVQVGSPDGWSLGDTNPWDDGTPHGLAA